MSRTQVEPVPSMGLELDLHRTTRSLRSVRFVLTALLLSWVVGPALALLLVFLLLTIPVTRVLAFLIARLVSSPSDEVAA